LSVRVGESCHASRPRVCPVLLQLESAPRRAFPIVARATRPDGHLVTIACLNPLIIFSFEARRVSRIIWRLSLASPSLCEKTGRSLPTASSRPHAIVVHATAPTSSRCPRGSGRHVSPPTLLHMALTLWLPLTLTLNLHRTPRAHPKPKAAIHIRRHHTPITKVWRSCPGPIRTCTAIVRYQPHSPAFASTWRRRHR